MIAETPRVLLIVGGGIAAYKSLELIRRLRAAGIAVRPVLTRAGAEFVTPLSLAALCEDKVHTDLFSLTDEAEMGHIRLSREADLVVVAPATADLMAKMAAGFASDLATTLLLATDKPVLIAPAMNVRMWDHAATQANLTLLKARGIMVVGPDEGDMACGEYGPGRMVEPDALAEVVVDALSARPATAGLARGGALSGLRALVTSGPTHEPIDPVRFIANRSSGRQGHAIAAALAGLGAEVKLVTGPVTLRRPGGMTVVEVETARQMLEACQAALPVDIAICAAAVADWAVADAADQKVKKQDGAAPPTLRLTENPDILATLSRVGPGRPRLVIGFAAETNSVIEHARAKRLRKGCDWMLANDVSPGTGTFGGPTNRIHLIAEDGEESWPEQSKTQVAARLAQRIATALSVPKTN